VHAAAHVGAQAGVAWVAIQLGDRWGTAVMIVCVVVLGGVVGSMTFGAYLIVAFSALERHDTETFSSFRHEGFKNFLRMHVTAEGITLYPIGIERICRDWVADPDAEGDDASYVRPRHGSIELRLIDEVLTLT